MYVDNTYINASPSLLHIIEKPPFQSITISGTCHKNSITRSSVPILQLDKRSHTSMIEGIEEITYFRYLHKTFKWREIIKTTSPTNIFRRWHNVVTTQTHPSKTSFSLYCHPSPSVCTLQFDHKSDVGNVQNNDVCLLNKVGPRLDGGYLKGKEKGSGGRALETELNNWFGCVLCRV